MRTLWISDLHLGTRAAKTALLLDFLESVSCEELYLVGDVVDGWSLRKAWFWDEAHHRVLERILALAAAGTRVTFVCGNHDEFLRRYVGLSLSGVEIRDEAVHVTREGKRLLVIHGDEFDAVVHAWPLLERLMSKAYVLSLGFDALFNRVRRWLGRPYWSLSAYLKEAVKRASSYDTGFEQAVIAETARRGFDGVVCGHIHRAALREVGGVLYCNDGDWVESCTALAEEQSGALELIHWTAAQPTELPSALLHAAV